MIRVPVRAWALLAAAAFLVALVRVSGFFTDDSYIHLVFARNLSRGLGYCFNPGEPVYGFTSPLWVLLLAAGHAVVADWVGLSRGLGILFTLLAVGSTFRLARAAGGGPAAALAAAVALAFHAWFLRWSLSGMETSLAAALVAAGLECSLMRRGIWGPVLLALAALARPEALLLFALALVWPGARGERAGGAWLGGLIGAALLGLWEWTIHGGTGAWIPTTFTVKRAHEALTASSFLTPTRHFAEVVGATDALLLPLALVSCAALARRRALPRGAGLLCAWPVLLAGLYLGTRFQMISRYWVPALPALCAAAWVGAERAFGGRWARGLLAVYLAQQLAVLVFLVGPQIDAFTRGARPAWYAPGAPLLGQGMEAGPARVGLWLKAESPPGSIVATPDIGAIGFFSERAVLDLGGLVTPAMGPVLAGHELTEINRRGLYEIAGHPDYLVDRSEGPGALSGPRYSLIMVSRMENLGISRPGPHFYSLYSVRRGAAP